MTERECWNCRHWRDLEGCHKLVVYKGGMVLTVEEKICDDSSTFKPKPDFSCKFWEEKGDTMTKGYADRMNYLSELRALCNQLNEHMEKEGSEGPCCSELLVAEPEAIEWEYMVTHVLTGAIDNSSQLEKWLNTLGLVGWEFIWIDQRGVSSWYRAIFKRRRRTEPEQDKCCECGG